jgi:hypothetical protein
VISWNKRKNLIKLTGNVDQEREGLKMPFHNESDKSFNDAMEHLNRTVNKGFITKSLE